MIYVAHAAISDSIQVSKKTVANVSVSIPPPAHLVDLSKQSSYLYKRSESPLQDTFINQAPDLKYTTKL